MVDAVSTQVYDLVVAGQGGTAPAQQTQVIDVVKFEQAMEAVTPEEVSPVENNGFKAAFGMLESLNGGVSAIGNDARSVLANANQMTPGDMISLTVKAQHFLFQSQLTANIANRTSEGVQQLFRQQS